MTRDIIRRNFDTFSDFDRVFRSFFEGFEEIGSNKYPPVNVTYFQPNKEEFEKTNESTRDFSFEELEPYFLIQVALAGFEKEDLQIQCDETVLRVSGSTEKADFLKEHCNVSYYDKKELLSNLAFRKFDRIFTFKVPVVVRDARFVNGMLSIYVYPKKPKTGQIVPIN